jgi:hypothetical protein
VTKDEGSKVRGFALATVLAVAAWHLGILEAFFLLPLQWIRVRQGKRPFLMASVLAAAGIGGVEAALKAVTRTPWTILDTAALGVPLVLIVGWAAIVLMDKLGWRFLYRLLAVTAVTGLVTFPVVSGLLAQPTFDQALQGFINAAWKRFTDVPGFNAAELTGTTGPAEFFGMLKQAFLGSYLVVLFLFWAVTARLARVFTPLEGLQTWKEFFVPPGGHWSFWACGG